MNTQATGRWGARASERAGARNMAMDMANDPPVSEPQRKAMFAAAAGHSTLGIPKNVGEEFVGKAKDGGPGGGPQGNGGEEDLRWHRNEAQDGRWGGRTR